MQTRKAGILLGMLCGASILMTACSIGGKKAVVTCDGYEVTLGKTTAGEIKEAGFTNFYANVEKETIDSMSWENFYAMKGDLSYGTMLAGNKGSSSIAFDKGKVFEISIDYDNPELSVGEILINGVDYQGCTRDEIKAGMGDAKVSLDVDQYLEFEIGSCEYTFSFEEGSETVTKIRVNDGTEKEYSYN
ncbi:MAG: hypothetical protein K2O99_01595 [Lachnospiraceae bacterium]|nr:hypothetical protein [Lachnospiraceae bacterium]MDE7029170.1 hypothetical protein [Lachnospiraceae bacterium]